MLNFDPYEALGVPKDADAASIKKTYWALARDYHPDINPNDPFAEEQIRKINIAYGILSDPEKLAEYERKSKAGRPRPPSPGSPSDSSAHRDFYTPPPPRPDYNEAPRRRKNSDHILRHATSSGFGPVFFTLMISLVFGLAYRHDIGSFFSEKKYNRVFASVAKEWSNITHKTHDAELKNLSSNEFKTADKKRSKPRKHAAAAGRKPRDSRAQIASAEIHTWSGGYGRVTYYNGGSPD